MALEVIVQRKRSYPSLRVWRLEARLQQGEAARFLGVSEGYYSRLERQLMFPHRRLAKTLCDKTGVPLETMLGI